MEPPAAPPTPDVSATTEGCEFDNSARQQFPTTVSHPAVSRCLRRLAGLEGEIREHLGNVDSAVCEKDASGGSGVDLRALIEAVETDIRRLERMEEKENVMERLELESLPGYRPKKSDPDDVYVHFSPSPILESPPPPLPPKKRTRRQQQQSRTSDRTEGLFQQRILGERPLKEEEKPGISVPEKPRQDKADFHNKLERCNSVSRMARLLFCPLCAQTFAHGFALECHLTSVHKGDVDCDSGGEVLQCPRCRAQFLRGAAVLRHLRCHHPEEAAAAAMASADRVASDGQSCPTEPTADRDASCRFCPQRFLRRHSKLLLLHLERSHAERLGEMMSTVADERTPEVNMALDMILDKRSVNVKSPSDLPLVEKSHFYYEINDSPSNHREDDGRPTSAMSASTPRRDQTNLVRRRRHGSAESPRRSPLKSHPGFSLTSPSARQVRLFRCNLCPASFLENAFLLSHIKSCHQLRPAGVLTGALLRPHYACGACPARFFKNSFLVRHVESRHQFQLVRN